MIYKSKSFITPTSVFNLTLHQHKGLVDVINKVQSGLGHMNFCLEWRELNVFYQPHVCFWAVLGAHER